ncbi:MAG: glycosyltransferase family 39 protein [Chloroflexota bacterium]
MRRWFTAPGFWFAILVAFLGVKQLLALFVFRQPGNAFLPDSFGYEDLAVNLLQCASFDVPGEPMVGLVRTPGYPVFIAGIYALAGRIPGWVIFVQLILDALTALLIWRIGRQYFSETAGVIGALIYAISLNATVGALYLLSDTLFTFLLVGALFLLSQYWRAPAQRWLISLGVILGLLPLVRPIGLYLALIWIAFFAIKQWKDSIKRWYRQPLVVGLLCAVLVAPWILRNYAATGRAMFSAAEAMNLYCCFAPAALAEDEKIPLLDARAQVDAPFRFQSLNTVEPRQLFLAADYAIQIILQHPLGYAKAHFKGVLATLFEPAYKQWLQLLGSEYTASGFLAKLMTLDLKGAIASLSETTAAGWFWLALPILNLSYTIAEYGLAVWGAWKISRQSLNSQVLALALLCAITIFYLVVAPGSGGGLRFRIPAEPLFALLAAVGLARTNFQMTRNS